jgi:hypothetical protein
MQHGSISNEVKQEPRLDLAQCMSHVMRELGKPVRRQISEIAGLAFDVGKVSPQEYYYYRLYEDQLTLAEKKEFVGIKAQDRIIQRCNPIDWWSIAHDKLVCCSILQDLGYPTPRIQGVFHPIRTYGNVPVLKDLPSLLSFLEQDARYPLFAKPITGIYSLGTAALDSFDPDTGALRSINGNQIDLSTFAADIAAYPDGYVFQELLHPHPRLRERCGAATCTVRLMIINTPHGPEPFRSLWKIAANGNIADNFWRSGNLLGDIDIETGRVTRVVTGYGPSQTEVDSHPDTGEQLRGIHLPDWKETLDLCRASASAFSGLKLQAWDIAISEKGPVLVEVNIGGDFNLPQLASGKGILDRRFRKFLGNF